jgi:hypothetical protein
VPTDGTALCALQVDSLNTDQIADAFYPVLFESGPTSVASDPNARHTRHHTRHLSTTRC